jgi:UDP-glucose 4-epimerase
VGNYLVTGGCGFIGSHLVDALCRRGHSVRIIDDLTTGKLAYKPPGVEFIRGDIAEHRIVAEAMQGVEGCFHLAAVVSVERGNSDWLGTHRTNLTGTVTVFDAARRASLKKPVPVVFASSAAVYGDNPNTPLSEDAGLQPLSAYGADKLGCELHGFVASHLHGMSTCGLRFFNVYGPRQDPKSPYSGVISIFCDRLKAGRGITMYGDGHQTRDFIYVRDVVLALLAAMDHCSPRGDIINICTGVATRIRDLAKAITDILETELDVAFEPPRPGEIRKSLGDPSKAWHLLGFAAETGLTAGLKRTLAAI